MVVRHLAGVAVGGDDGGDEGGDPHGVGAGVRVVAVELDQVVDGQHDADQVHEDPQEVDDVVTEWSLGNRASKRRFHNFGQVPPTIYYAFTFKTLLKHFAKRVPKHVKLGH